MTRVSAAKYLGQLERQRTRLDMDMERLEQMRSDVYGASGLNYSRERVQASPDKDQQSATLVRLLDFQALVDEEIKAYSRLEDEITARIDALSGTQEKMLLFKVYVQFKTVRQAAEELYVSRSYAYKVHNRAIKEFESMYPELYA